MQGGTALKSNLLYLRPRRVGFIRATGPYSTACATAWDQMLEWLDKSGLRQEVAQGFGLSHDNPDIVPPEDRRYDACIELPPGINESDLQGLLFDYLPGGAYARHRHRGDYKLNGKLIKLMRDEWAATSGLEIDHTRPFVEIHLDDPQTCETENLRADLCLPVAAAIHDVRSRQFSG